MRTLLVLIVCCFCINSSFAQTEETYIVKAGEILPAKTIFALLEFAEGTALLRDGTAARQRFNFNCLTGQMQFINQKGDTLDIAEPGLIKEVIVDSVIFYYDKNFLQQTFSARQFKLAKLQVLMQAPEKISGGYGTANEGVSVTKSSGIN